MTGKQSELRRNFEFHFKNSMPYSRAMSYLTEELKIEMLGYIWEQIKDAQKSAYSRGYHAGRDNGLMTARQVR